MQEHIKNGVALGWLIDPKLKQIFVSHSKKQVEILEHPSDISGELLLKVFMLKLKQIWE